MPNDKKKRAYSSNGQMKAPDGQKMTIVPKKGESSTKQVKVGRASADMPNGIIAPKPTTSAKFSAPVKVAKKPSYKAPNSRQTGMKKMSKTGSKRGGMKCY